MALVGVGRAGDRDRDLLGREGHVGDLDIAREADVLVQQEAQRRLGDRNDVLLTDAAVPVDQPPVAGDDQDLRGRIIVETHAARTLEIDLAGRDGAVGRHLLEARLERMDAVQILLDRGDRLGVGRRQRGMRPPRDRQRRRALRGRRAGPAASGAEPQ